MLVGAALLSAPALAGDAPACKTHDSTPACCPHAPPSCCAPELRQLDERVITEICGAAPYLGEAAGANVCNRYLERGGTKAQVTYGRERGDQAAFAKLRATLGGPRAKVLAQSIVGARQGFVIREVDEEGRPSRASAWAFSEGEIVHVEVEASLCDDKQVIRLLERALVRPSAPGQRPG